MPSSVKYWLLVGCLLAAGYGSLAWWRATQRRVEAGPAAAAPRQAQPVDLSGPVADFSLVDQQAQTFDSGQLKGKVWVASFFFTNCPAVCWRMNQALSAYQQTHPHSQAQFVSITCDPDNDTPEALKKYAEHFKADPARWTFLTGDIETIKRIGQDSFQISVVEKDHTDRACVVDAEGQVRGRFRLTEPDQLELLERLLAVVEAEAAQPARAAHSGDAPAAAAESPPAEAGGPSPAAPS